MKRAVDLVLGGLLFVLTLPVQLVVGIVSLAVLGRPVLFRQDRIGWAGSRFRLVKFRTMREFDAERGWVTDGQRLTGWGRWLRASSLDELPALWNVIRGDLSLVGPRPLLPSYVDRYTPEQARRHEVRPGITGWAQVHGRNAVDWERRFALDVWYVDNASLWLDLRILIRTVGAVLRRDGISAGGHDTMPEFEGSEGAAGLTSRVTEFRGSEPAGGSPPARARRQP